MKLSTSKKAIDLHVMVMELPNSKGINNSQIKFTGLDGTNIMIREREGLKRLIHHDSPHSLYLNRGNDCLALSCSPSEVLPKMQQIRWLTYFVLENIQI